MKAIDSFMKANVEDGQVIMCNLGPSHNHKIQLLY